MRRKNYSLKTLKELLHMGELYKDSINFLNHGEYTRYLNIPGITPPLEPFIEAMKGLFVSMERFPEAFPEEKRMNLVRTIKGLEFIAENYVKHAQSLPLETAEELVAATEALSEENSLVAYVLDTK